MKDKIFSLVDPVQRDLMRDRFGSDWLNIFGRHLDRMADNAEVPTPRPRTALLHDLVQIKIPVTESTWVWIDNWWDQADERMGAAIAEFVQGWL